MNWKNKIHFIEFNKCQYADYPNKTKEELLQEEIELFNELLEDDNFWIELDDYADSDDDGTNRRLIHKFVEDKTEWLVDKIIFTDGTEYKDSMFYHWIKMIDEFSDPRYIDMTDHFRKMLEHSTYSLRQGWVIDGGK